MASHITRLCIVCRKRFKANTTGTMCGDACREKRYEQRKEARTLQRELLREEKLALIQAETNRRARVLDAKVDAYDERHRAEVTEFVKALKAAQI